MAVPFKPFKYIGGKRYLLTLLKKVVPEGGTPYCEPYAGSASLLWVRARAPMEVINDINEDLVNFYRVLQNKESYERLKHVLSWTLYSRAELARAVAILKSDERDAVMRAWAFFLSFEMGFGGRQAQAKSDWGYSFARAHPSWFANKVEALDVFHARLRNVFVECDDGIRCIERYDNPDAVFYIDPPYHPDTLRDKKTYAHMMSAEQHDALVEALMRVKGAAVLSGYDHPVYERLEKAGWVKVKVEVVAHSSGATRKSNLRGENARRNFQKRTETVWINPKARGAGDLSGLFHGGNDAV